MAPAFLLALGIGLMVISGRMVLRIDDAPIPDAVERWGPDGYSMFHGFALTTASLFLLAISGLLEVGAMLITKRGPVFSRFLTVYAVAILLLGAGAVWGCWGDWQEARRYATIRANKCMQPTSDPSWTYGACALRESG
ncbi:MAG: hypothetical protein GY721_12395 [Deltaproteobacteria bacterium]|nr:hypothetical protein [Deltaproteobacteria bacterium]